MIDDRFGRLSSRQLDCLRLLPIAGSSKGIAERLNISPGTVDQHLKAARRMLGVNDSWTASQLVLEYLQSHPQKLDTQPQSVVAPAGTDATGTGTNDRSEEPSEIVGDERDDKDATETSSIQLNPRLFDLLFPPVGRPSNDLSVRSRLSLICVQTILAIGAISMLFALVSLMSRLLISLARYGG